MLLWRTDVDGAPKSPANAAMVDSDNVLLLRNARPKSGFDIRGLTRPVGSAPRTAADSLVAASVFMLESPADEAFITAVEDRLVPEIQPCAHRIACLVTDDRPNEFPQLPVREGEWALVLVGVCSSLTGLDAWVHAIDSKGPETSEGAVKNVETLRLEPASRSLYR